MNDSCHLMILDLHCPQNDLTVTAKKGDTGRTLKFILTDNGSAYTISSDCYAVFTALKPDGSILYNDCSIADNTILYAFTAQTCAVTGSLSCQIKLYGADDKLITSPGFTLEVEDTVYSDGDIVESASEVSALTALISKTSALISDVEQKLEENAYADAHSAVCYTAQALTQDQKFQARENISAAPDGYGLGSQTAKLTAADDLNAVTANGWYYWSSGDAPANVPAHAGAGCMGAMRVWTGTGGQCCQELMDLTNGAYQGCVMQRLICGSVFYAWEWVNPPMEPDTEYRTVRRFGTKPVYVKRVSLGTLPQAAAESTAFSSETGGVIRPISVSGTFGETQDSQTGTLPTNSYDSVIGQVIDITASDGSVTVVSNFDASGCVGYAVVEYWKSTDTILQLTSQPVNAQAALADTVCFSVEASGTNLSYQWQWRKNSSSSWNSTTVSGNKTSEITVEVTATRNGYQYRCVITDAAGSTAYSNAAVLTVTA